MKLTDEQLRELAEYLIGTANSIQCGLDALGLPQDGYDVSEIEADLLDVEVELCQICGWWCECSELVADSDEETGCCEGCRS